MVAKISEKLFMREHVTPGRLETTLGYLLAGFQDTDAKSWASLFVLLFFLFFYRQALNFHVSSVLVYKWSSEETLMHFPEPNVCSVWAIRQRAALVFGQV
jgi:hypothetical protein